MSDFNTQIIEEFRANEGRVGGPFEGATMLLLHTTGAKSGEQRINPLVYFPQPDGSMLIAASAAGAKSHPAWYHNLQAHPATEIEVGTETVAVSTEDVTGAERDKLWSEITTAAPGFADYEGKAAPRVIPVVRLTRS